MKAPKLCDVCGCPVEELELVSSGIGPVTYNACNECLLKGAENINIICIWLLLDGENDEYASFCGGLISFLDGNYVGWEKIKMYFEFNRSKMT